MLNVIPPEMQIEAKHLNAIFKGKHKFESQNNLQKNHLDSQ